MKEGGDATLVLMGAKLMSLPEEPFIRFAGLLSDRERLQALEAATVVVCPSPYESLSLLALEAMSVGTPVLVNARSAVLVEHCVRSNGGLYYADRDEFVECLKLLVRDDRLRAALGRNGRDYIRRQYRWDVVLGNHLNQKLNLFLIPGDTVIINKNGGDYKFSGGQSAILCQYYLDWGKNYWNNDSFDEIKFYSLEPEEFTKTAYAYLDTSQIPLNELVKKLNNINPEFVRLEKRG